MKNASELLSFKARAALGEGTSVADIIEVGQYIIEHTPAKSSGGDRKSNARGARILTEGRIAAYGALGIKPRRGQEFRVVAEQASKLKSMPAPMQSLCKLSVALAWATAEPVVLKEVVKRVKCDPKTKVTRDALRSKTVDELKVTLTAKPKAPRTPKAPVEDKLAPGTTTSLRVDGPMFCTFMSRLAKSDFALLQDELSKRDGKFNVYGNPHYPAAIAPREFRTTYITIDAAGANPVGKNVPAIRVTVLVEPITVDVNDEHIIQRDSAKSRQTW